MTHLNAEQVARREHENFSPLTNDFRWNTDYTEVDVIPLLYWDDASYAAYQTYCGPID